MIVFNGVGTEKRTSEVKTFPTIEELKVFIDETLLWLPRGDNLEVWDADGVKIAETKSFYGNHGALAANQTEYAELGKANQGHILTWYDFE